jgi:hypothetical protein
MFVQFHSNTDSDSNVSNDHYHLSLQDPEPSQTANIYF